MSPKQFAHFVQKVFVRKILPTGKLGLFRPLYPGTNDHHIYPNIKNKDNLVAQWATNFPTPYILHCVELANNVTAQGNTTHSAPQQHDLRWSRPDGFVRQRYLRVV